MKKSEYYQNLYPYEDILPELDEKEISDCVSDCDYTIEANKICEADKIDNKVNIADAIVFFQMGYKEAKDRVCKCLIPIEK